MLLTNHTEHIVQSQEPLVASLFLEAMPFAPSSFLLLVVRPGAPSSVLAPMPLLDVNSTCWRFVRVSFVHHARDLPLVLSDCFWSHSARDSGELSATFGHLGRGGSLLGQQMQMQNVGAKHKRRPSSYYGSLTNWDRHNTSKHVNVALKLEFGSNTGILVPQVCPS